MKDFIREKSLRHFFKERKDINMWQTAEMRSSLAFIFAVLEKSQVVERKPLCLRQHLDFELACCHIN
jgi:hypothetical protein